MIGLIGLTLLLVDAAGSFSDESSIFEGHVEEVEIEVDLTRIWSSTSEDFVCVTLDWWPDSKSGGWTNASLQVVDLKAPLFQEALHALSPLYLRLGGSLQDQITYTVTNRRSHSTSSSTWPDWSRCDPLTPSNTTYSRFQGGCLHLKRLKEFDELCEVAKCKIVFGLGYLYGRQLSGKRDWSGMWNASNAELLLRFVWENKLKNFAGFELGNEVDGQSGILARIPADQYAHDLTQLRKLVDTIWGAGVLTFKPLVMGTDTAHYNASYTRDLLSQIGENVLDGFTYHNYMLGMSEDPAVSERILDPFFIQDYRDLAHNLSRDVRQIHPELQVWLGEAGGAAHSGRQGVTDAFISSFWYLDQLGQASLHNHQTFCRQTFVGGHYSLLQSANGPPNPDFYVAYLWRLRMGSRVLRSKSTATNVKVYASCGRRMKGLSPSVSLVLLNFSRDHKAKIDLRGATRGHCSFREQYVFKAPGSHIYGRDVEMNGRLLRAENGSLPELLPNIVDCMGNEFILEPLSYAFVEIHGSAGVCVGSWSS